MLNIVKVDVDGGAMAVEVTRPEAGTPLPGIVLCHHREGVDEFTRDAADRLADAGYVVAVPNMYHRRPSGETWEVSRKTMQDVEVVADIKATAEFLKRQPFVRADSIAIVGHCMGGRSAFIGVAATPLFKAAVVLYGGHIFKTEGQGMPAPIALVGNIKAEMLNLYGTEDHIIPLDEGRKLEQVWKDNHVKSEFHIYEKAGHAFQDFSRPDHYRKAASDDAWTRIVTFLRKVLRPGAPS